MKTFSNYDPTIIKMYSNMNINEQMKLENKYKVLTCFNEPEREWVKIYGRQDQYEDFISYFQIKIENNHKNYQSIPFSHIKLDDDDLDSL